MGAQMAHGDLIADWGGYYVSANQLLNVSQGTANGDWNEDGISGDQRRWSSFSTVTPLNPQSNYTAPDGKSATFYGGIFIDRYSPDGSQKLVDPFIASSVGVLNNAAGDRLAIAARDGQEWCYGVVLFDKADFLSGDTVGPYAFGFESRLALTVASANRTAYRFLVVDNGITYVSDAYTTTQTDLDPYSMTWYTHTFDDALGAIAAGSMKLPVPSDAASPWFNDITAVGFTVQNQSASGGGMAVSGFSVSADGVVPEPGTLVLLGLGVSALAMRRRRKQSVTSQGL